MGVVYVFNATTVPLRLSINSQPSVAMQPASKTRTPPYTPFGSQVARSNVNPTPGAFINGQANILSLQTSDKQQSDDVPIKIPLDSASTPDLWLYVFWNLLILLDTAGAPQDQQWVAWPGEDVPTGPASAAGSRLIDRGPVTVKSGRRSARKRGERRPGTSGVASSPPARR